MAVSHVYPVIDFTLLLLNGIQQVPEIQYTQKYLH